MDYKHRALERKVMSMSSAFKALMVVGARQIGKSTMLQHLAEGQKRVCVSMDDSRLRELARSDPRLFFQMYPPPLLIDEVQKAPELFEQIKIICDSLDKKGLFWLTGSQSKNLAKCAGDSLAGRLCVLKMYSLSLSEILGVLTEQQPDFSFPALTERSRLLPVNNIKDIYGYIWRGGMPETLSLNDAQLYEYWNSYIDTYLMRDAVDDNRIGNTEGLRRFMRACAAFSGQMLSFSSLAEAAGISMPTAKEWIRILQNMGIVYLVEPFSSNEIKRLTKTPKLYFCDTGLCAFLSFWTDRDTLMNGAASGRFFENYVTGQLLRAFAYNGGPVNMTYYRDQNKKEIDLIIEQDGKLHPLEIKRSADPDKKLVRGFDVLNKATLQTGAGGIVCMAEAPFPIDSNNSLIPANIL